MFAKDFGIDLGTANTLVYAPGKGIIMNEPSVVAIDTKTSNVIAVGDEARDMIGRTPANIEAIRPLRDGVIADFDVTAAMLKYFITKSGGNGFFSKPRVVICVPTGATDVEKRAIIEAAISAGSNEKCTYLIEEPMAAALGAGLDISSPKGCMIVDIGGGTSEVAVISLGGIVTSASVRMAGDAFDTAIINYVKKQYNLAIGERSAEELKIGIGTAYIEEDENVKEAQDEISEDVSDENLNEDSNEAFDENSNEALNEVSNKASNDISDEISMEVKGRDLISGLPKTAVVTEREIHFAISECIATIVEAVKNTLESTPPELSSDIMERGIVITGGGALLDGIDTLLAKETKMPVYIAPDAVSAVAKGTGKALENISALKNTLISTKNMRL